jgi:hypothetical protein
MVSCSKKEKKNEIGNGYSIQYEFVEQPKLGTVVLKINVYDTKNNLINDANIFVGYDMPSMRGYHATLPTKVYPNNSNNYLHPINFVMRGKWEITLDFRNNDGKSFHKEIINVNI